VSSCVSLCIGDFCKTGSGGTPSRSEFARYYEGGTIPWIKSGELRENVIHESEEYVSEVALRETSIKLVPKGAILLAMYGATVGRMALLGTEATTNQAVCHIVPDPAVADTPYVFHALSSLVPTIVGMGVGGAQPNINQGIVKGLKVRLPPLPEQRRIAAILDKADALRTKRREALAQLDRLAQSIFVEMFGDPVTNPKGWPVSSLSAICSSAGEYGAGLPSRDYDPSLPRYVRITDINEQGDLSDNPVSPSGASSDWARYELRVGDVLFARSGATVGKTFIYKEADGPCVFAGYLIRFRPKVTSALSSFVFAFTKTAAYQAWVAARQRVVAQPNINAQQFGEDLMIPVPPLGLQLEFERKMAQLAKHKIRLNEWNEKHMALVASLQHRAFQGEL
jgi:type I restriction enzyme S subunit